MTTEHTPAEVAAAHRVLADDEERRWGKLHRSGTAPIATWHREEADKLDPPKPAIPDGLYCWKYDDGMVTYIRRLHGCWLDGYGKVDDQMTPPADVSRVRRLADDEMAIKLFGGAFVRMPEGARRYADDLRAAGFGVGSLMFRKIADALDAEDGDSK